MSITGNGNASKEQVAAMLSQILGLKNEHAYLDATDAMGAALCHYYQNKKQVPVENRIPAGKHFSPKILKGKCKAFWRKRDY